MEGISLTVPIFTSKETCRTWRGFSTRARSPSTYILLENKHTYPQSPPSISSTSSIRVSWIQRFHTTPIILKITNLFNNNSSLASRSHPSNPSHEPRAPPFEVYPDSPIPTNTKERENKKRERERGLFVLFEAFWTCRRESVHLKPLQNQNFFFFFRVLCVAKEIAIWVLGVRVLWLCFWNSGIHALKRFVLFVWSEIFFFFFFGCVYEI